MFSTSSADDAADAADARSNGLVERLTRARDELASLTDTVPDRADPASVAAWLDSFRRLESVVASLRSRLVACVQASRVDQDGGHASTASYLREHLGVSGREAKRQDVIARDLRQLPETRAALTAGDIGPEQAQAIGAAARRGALGDHAATEQQLLPAAADQGADEFRRHIRGEEQSADRRSQEREEQRAHRRRRASLVRRNDGMWDLHALLTDEDGELLATALDAFRTPDAPGTPLPEQRSPEQRTADALTDVIDAALRPGAPTSGGVRPHLNLVIPIDLLDPDSAELATAGHGGVFSSAAVARLLCDANLRRVVTRGDSEVLDLGRSKRQWSVAQRQALNIRDGGCRAPGCDRPVAWTDAHHIHWWSKGGPTSVDNGLLLCRRHHRMVHEGGWTVALDVASGAARFRSPTGREVVTYPHGARGDRTRAASRIPPAAASPTGSAAGPAAGPPADPATASVDSGTQTEMLFGEGGQPAAVLSSAPSAPAGPGQRSDAGTGSKHGGPRLARESRADYRTVVGPGPPGHRGTPQRRRPPPARRLRRFRAEQLAGSAVSVEMMDPSSVGILDGSAAAS